MKRKKEKRLSPYRRLEMELANAREALSDACYEYTKVLAGLTQLLVFFDRIQHAEFGWTAADVLRIAEIRKLTAFTDRVPLHRAAFVGARRKKP